MQPLLAVYKLQSMLMLVALLYQAEIGMLLKTATTLLNRTFHNIARIIICAGWISRMTVLTLLIIVMLTITFLLWIISHAHHIQLMIPIRRKFWQTGHNTSDHFAISLEVKILSCSSNPQPKRQYSTKLRWDRTDLLQYQHMCSDMLARIQLPAGALLCTYDCCTAHMEF